MQSPCERYPSLARRTDPQRLLRAVLHRSRITPPTASLGAILNDSVAYAIPDPAYFIFPGLTVFFIVLAFNLLGDGLRDALDPKAGRS